MVRHKANAARTHRGRFCCLAVACLLAAVGCSNSRQVQTDLVHRQMRLQEDEIYQLEDYLEEYQALVRGYRCEVADLKRQLAAAQGETPSSSSQKTPTPAEAEPESLPDPADSLPEIEMPDVETPEPEPIAPPIDLEDAAGEAPPFNAGVQAADRSRVELARAIRPVEEDATPPAPFAPVPYPIARPINPLTGVDDTLSLEVEPGPSPGELLVWVTDTLDVTEGRVSVMLTDPTVEGRLRRIARWDYTQDETADAAQPGAEGGQRLRLLIAAPEGVPRDRPVRLWVRLLDGERRRLQATPLTLDEDGHPAGFATAPQRLPAPTETGGTASVPPEPLNLDTGWRPARRTDRTIMTVGYDSPAE